MTCSGWIVGISVNAAELGIGPKGCVLDSLGKFGLGPSVVVNWDGWCLGGREWECTGGVGWDWDCLK